MDDSYRDSNRCRVAVSTAWISCNNLFYIRNDFLWKLDTTNDAAVEVAFAEGRSLTEFNGSLIYVDSWALESNGTEAVRP